LVATTRANRKATIVRDSLKAAGSETCGATYRNRIGGGATQGERARNREALATKEWSVNLALVQGQSMSFTWGDLASCLKG
jgi:hypothetical protein